jgi:AbrB family looped-hinge helix DNA binding protein
VVVVSQLSELSEATMPSLRVGRRGQITIPSDVRKELRLGEGARLIAMVRDGELVLRPAGRSILELRGSVPVEGPQDFDAIRAEVARGRAERTVSDDGR